MYPIFRLAKERLKSRSATRLPITGTHVSHHICWPWDLDPWMELNNGHTLTLYDLGRIPFTVRAGLRDVMKANGWGLAVAGNATRYRRRVKAFYRIEMRTRCIGWDTRFLYFDQSMWTRGDCSSQSLARLAVTSENGIVPPAQVLAALGSPESPALPDWVQAWSQAEGMRPWPPQP